MAACSLERYSFPEFGFGIEMSRIDHVRRLNTRIQGPCQEKPVEDAKLFPSGQRSLGDSISALYLTSQATPQRTDNQIIELENLNPRQNEMRTSVSPRTPSSSIHNHATSSPLSIQISSSLTSVIKSYIYRPSWHWSMVCCNRQLEICRYSAVQLKTPRIRMRPR